MSNATVIDEKALNDCLNEITRALLQSDVQFKLVHKLQANIKKIVNLDDLATGHNKRKIIQQAVFNELCKMLDLGKPFLAPKKGKTRVVLFVGLQGSGKTTTCTKYAYCHQKKGWKPALVCADTFRAGVFDQLKQPPKLRSLSMEAASPPPFKVTENAKYRLIRNGLDSKVEKSRANEGEKEQC